MNYIDGLFYNVIGSERELNNIMKRASTKSDIVNYALTETFGNPASYIEEFSKRIEIGNFTVDDNKAKVIKFHNKKQFLEKNDYDY